MIKKTFCLMISALIAFSAASDCVLADEGGEASTKVGLVDAAYIRYSSSMADKVMGGAMLVVDNKDGTVTSSQRRMGFMKFDFSDYMDDIDSISEVKLFIASKDAAATEDVNFTLMLMPDDKEQWDSSTLTFNIANLEMDMARADCGEAVYSGTMINNRYVETGDIKEAVAAHLKENPSNSIVTFKVDAALACAYQIYGKGSAYEPYISVKQSVDINAVLEEEYEKLTFESINSSPQDAVAADFDFVRTGSYGTVISWKSSDEDVINSKTGVVTRPKKGEGDKKVILTAIIQNGEYSLEKEFEVYVSESDLLPLEMLRSETVYAYSTSYVRSGSSFKDMVYENQNIVVDSKNSGSSHRMGFIKFDFSGYEDVIEQMQRVTLKLDTYTDAKAENGSNFVIYVLPDSMEDGLDSSTLTYSEAEKRGLITYTDNLVYVSPNGLKPSTTYETDDFCSKVKENLEGNPDNKVIWIKVSTTEGAAYSINGGNANKAIKPKLILGYPKIPIELDTIALKLPSSTGTSLALPETGEYGSQITWHSDNEKIITSEGIINAGSADEDFSKEDPIVTFTATLTNGDETREKDIEVRAVRKGVTDAAADTYINAEANYADDESIIFGGSSGNYAFIEFDIGTDCEYIQGSRKTVLKVYATEENAGEDIELICVSDSRAYSLDIESLSYEEAEELAGLQASYKLQSKINADGYALFDVTEYIMQLTDKKALFLLDASGKRVFLHSTESSAKYQPKLISSNIEYTDEYGVQRAAEELLFENLSSDPADNVRGDLSLPVKSVFGAEITWSSSDAAALNPADGKVTRGTDNKNITLTAAIKVGEATAEKSFEIVVIKQETDTEYAQYLASTLKPSKSILTASITLPGEQLPDGAEVVWSSSHDAAAVDGYNLVIKRDSNSDLKITLTATVKYNESTASEDYDVTIIRSADKNILRNRKIITGDDEAANAIDENIDTVWHIQNSEVVYDMGSNKFVSSFMIVPRKNSFSGIAISVSKDNLTWDNIYSGGSFTPDTLNRVSLTTAGYGRYLKLEFPDSASDIAFIAAYSSAENQSDDIFASVSVPEKATTSFDLITELDGNEVSWSSSSDNIRIDGSRAIVKQSSKGMNITLNARVNVNGVEYEKSYVIYIPSSGSGSSGGGGGGGSASGSTTHLVPTPNIKTQPTQSQGTVSTDEFKDISGCAWAREYINTLAGKGIISGKKEGMFYPHDYIKREEMAKILVLAFDITAGDADASFTDVVPESWYEKYVHTLVSSGGASGTGNGMFGVEQNITRQDAFKMIASVIGADTVQHKATEFKDSEDIAEYALNSVSALCDLGIIGGDENGYINPKLYITRAEAAKVVCLASEYMNR